MLPSKLFQTEDLARLHADKVFNVRKAPNNQMIEYVIRYEHVSDPSKRYHVCAVGINGYGVHYKASSLKEKNGQYFFQIDTNKTYDKAIQNPSLLYSDPKLALCIR